MTDLSPAAQAVLAAFGEHPLHGDHIVNDLIKGALPAALETVADQVVPCEKAPDLMSSPDLERLAQRQHTRTQLLAIAAEPRGITTTTQEDN